MTTRAPLAALGLLLASCTSIAVAPRSTEDDVEVLLIDEGWHKGLVLPEEGGKRVEWGFGDYAWYALEQNHWYDVFATVLWPSQGCLSRREWSEEERELRRAGDVVAFRAPRERVAVLARELEAEFAGAPGEPVWNAASRTAFVRHRRDYWLLHDCHDETAQWLVELGCTVEPALVRGGIALRTESDRAAR